jgi:hypothetical protein
MVPVCSDKTVVIHEVSVKLRVRGCVVSAEPFEGIVNNHIDASDPGAVDGNSHRIRGGGAAADTLRSRIDNLKTPEQV